MLAAQMAGIHMATMRMMERLANADDIPGLDSTERALNNLARTFAGQVEALKRYRTDTEQKVTVQHMSVSDGGQAIVSRDRSGAGCENGAAADPRKGNSYDDSRRGGE
jgi:hypothetical protein